MRRAYWALTKLAADQYLVRPACTRQTRVFSADASGAPVPSGPMVYGICYCPLDRADDLKALGFADSKTLNEEARERLLEVIRTNADYIGWSVRVLSPQDISQSMLRRNKYNLNSMAHDTTIRLLREAIASGVNVTEIYVDTVGPPESYQAKLARLFPQARVTVTKKADSLFPVVSAASICAKVTRDAIIKQWMFAEPGAEAFADPNTVAWLNANVDPVFGFPGIVRFSWATTERLLEKSAIGVEW
ncbi:Rnaseh2a protein [Thamnocephalis sphaerospora]|uniref:Ribonuclease n=1 Tax=Thamnocephalis sphaerospora TaxID=78915 RepID=A0A4P9XV39_9FUNG|nr:Rnaseh2a protein [Thamnocephalis sphaerospora]|eukprot:RKP10134.1 Rnaseh2a protein [Thamnocephalis sphaerospora]